MTTPSDPRRPAAENHGGTSGSTLALIGDLDYATSGDLLTRAAHALAAADGAHGLAVDCHRLAFIDSVGLSSLLQIRQDGAARGIAVRLVRIGPRLRRLLELTGTYDHLTAGAPRSEHG
ncbi:STAS domain-containing protein [Streptomyces sp. NPDC101181]|uniref:STAS domain-containing protein n=1 Tax=Streptomyces sp. NPDC101181 TaxID=3366125 RepID=UPI00381D9FDD